MTRLAGHCTGLQYSDAISSVLLSAIFCSFDSCLFSKDFVKLSISIQGGGPSVEREGENSSHSLGPSCCRLLPLIVLFV